MRALLSIACSLFLLALTAWLPGNVHPLTIRLAPVVGNEPLVLGNSYQTVMGERVTINKFKYYISHIAVTDTKGTTTAFPKNYFLVDAADTASQSITLNIPSATIKSISFLLGVDSVRNVSGVQTGALDPLNGMFWTWNSGYIMAKLEGSSNSSSVAGRQFTYHIGGFKKENNSARIITLQLPGKNEPVKEISLAANINAWFKSKHELKIAETPVCHSPGALAMKIADNYSTMFTLTAIQ